MDGKIIAISRGRPDFGLLQSRIYVRHPPPAWSVALVQLYLFDLLHHDGQSLLTVAYRTPRAAV
jgi:ATP-dependent DNA ligase